MKTPKACIGCNSYQSRCISYIGGNGNKPFHSVFRNRFCPCATCIVKVTCQDPKYEQLQMPHIRNVHQCQKFYESVCDFWEYKGKNGLNHTVLKRKKRKRRV